MARSTEETRTLRRSQDELISILLQAAEQLAPVAGGDAKKRSQIRAAAITLVKSQCDPIEAVRTLLPAGYQVIETSANSHLVQSILRGIQTNSWGTSDPGSEVEHIPKDLIAQSKIKKSVVTEALLWVQGSLSNINHIVVKASGLRRPVGLVAGTFSAKSVDRNCYVSFNPPYHDDYRGRVIAYPRERKFGERSYHCFARVLCFNDDLELDDKTKFDIAVDKDHGSYILDPKIYWRTFVGKIPQDENGKPVEVAVGVGNDWYHVTIRRPTGRNHLKGLTGQLDCDTITCKSDLRMRFESHIRYPQNHDYLIEWSGVYKKRTFIRWDRYQPNDDGNRDDALGNGGDGGDSGRDNGSDGAGNGSGPPDDGNRSGDSGEANDGENGHHTEQQSLSEYSPTPATRVVAIPGNHIDSDSTSGADVGTSSRLLGLSSRHEARSKASRVKKPTQKTVHASATQIKHKNMMSALAKQRLTAPHHLQRHNVIHSM